MALTTNLQAYWKLNENTGTTSADATGNGHTGTFNTTPTWVTGFLGAGIHTAGDGYLTTNVTFPGSGSLSAWHKVDSHPFDFVGTLGWLGGGNTVGISVFNASGRWTFVFAPGGGAETDRDGGAITNGAWAHVVITWNLVSTTWTTNLYVNGTAKGSNTYTGTAASLGTLCIASLGPANPFVGTIDEVGYWDRAISQAEVTSLYNGGAGFAYPFLVPTSGGNPNGLNSLSNLNMLNLNIQPS